MFLKLFSSAVPYSTSTSVEDLSFMSLANFLLVLFCVSGSLIDHMLNGLYLLHPYRRRCPVAKDWSIFSAWITRALLETKVGLCGEPTQFQSGQAKRFSIVRVEGTVEGDIRRVVRYVIAEDRPVVSLRGCTPTPIPPPLTRSITSAAVSKLKLAWVCRLGKEKQNKMSLFHAQRCLPGSSSARGNHWDCSFPRTACRVPHGFPVAPQPALPSQSRVKPSVFTPDHRHLWWRASCLLPSPALFPVELGSLLVCCDAAPWQWVWQKSFQFLVYGYSLSLVWYCHGVRYLWRIRLISVRPCNRGSKACILPKLSCLQVQLIASCDVF